MNQLAIPLDGHCSGPLFAPLVKTRPPVRPKGKEGIVHRQQTKRCTPPWADADAIAAFYAEAHRLTVLTGELHVVNHVIPKIHPLVCGLHVQGNLQVIHWLANATKGNFWAPQLDIFTGELAW